jgi:hypothetical protein
VNQTLIILARPKDYLRVQQGKSRRTTMNAITKTISLHHSRAHHSAPHSIWHDTGVGLAIGLTVAILALVQIGVNPGGQSVGSWPGATQSTSLSDYESTGLPDRLPIDPLMGDSPM